MLRLILFASIAALSGCATTQTVRVPVPVPCVTSIPDAPASEFDALPENSPLFTYLQSLLIDRERDRAHIGELRGILEGCRF